MNENKNNSLNYAKYRTFCILSEEMIREYGRTEWMEKVDEVYKRVKQKIMELPIEEAEKQMKQVDLFFQNILEGKSFTVETEEKTIRRPRLKITGTCPSCQKKTYLQFTDGYFCPNCNSLHVIGNIDSKKKNLSDRMKKVLFECKSNPKKVIDEVASMILSDPYSAQLYVRMGLAYRQLNDNEMAMQFYQEALKLDDRDGTIYSNQGVVFSLQGEYVKAKEAFEKAYACWEADNYSDWRPEVMFANYAVAIQKTGNPQKAFDFLKKAQQGGYENCDIVFMNWGVGKELCNNRLLQLIKSPPSPYSIYLKKDHETIQKVKKHFSINDEKQIHYFIDYTVFGGCKEGIVICTDGIYFKMLSSKIKVIKWYELTQYEFQIAKKDIVVKKNGESFGTMYFLQKQDADNFHGVLLKMQQL